MVRVAVTGAAGSVGREALRGLKQHTVKPLTHRSHGDIESEIVDIEDQSALRDAFKGYDVVVHLAGNPNASADWESVLHTNIDGTFNVYEAAVANDIDRVIFASTNHLTAMYNIVDDEIGTMVTDPATVVSPDSLMNPDSYYGISKITGEALGKYYSQRHSIEVVNFRIGWLLTRDELRKKNKREPKKARFARALWLSPRDCRHAFQQAVEVELPENPLTLHIISENADRYLTLTETVQGLDYNPEDDSSEVVGW